MSGQAGGILSAFSEILAGKQARDVGQRQYQAYREQARATGIEARASEAALRRQTRRAFGELRAAGAEAGVAGSATFADAYSQSAAEAELDALNIRYQGESRRQGLLFESKMAQKMRPTWGSILLSAGARGLSANPWALAGHTQAPAPVVTSKPSWTR